jgi:hypothetical protein
MFKRLYIALANVYPNAFRRKNYEFDDLKQFDRYLHKSYAILSKAGNIIK